MVTFTLLLWLLLPGYYGYFYPVTMVTFNRLLCATMVIVPAQLLVTDLVMGCVITNYRGEYAPDGGYLKFDIQNSWSSLLYVFY